MSGALWIGGLLIGAVVAVIAWASAALRTRRSALPAELRDRREHLQRQLAVVVDQVSVSPSVSGPGMGAGELPQHPQAGKVEAHLLAAEVASAVDIAESAMAADPTDPRGRLLLCRTLVVAGDFDAAQQQLARAVELGATGPLVDYLTGRIRQREVERRTGQKGGHSPQLPPLITPFEMFVLQAEQQRRLSARAAALWLATATGEHATVSHDEIRELVIAHFRAYYDLLDIYLGAAARQPGFADTLYHAARMALKVGFVEHGRELMERIEPLMAGSIDRKYYERDLAALRDEPERLTAPAVPEIGPKGRRAKSLRVLNS